MSLEMQGTELGESRCYSARLLDALPLDSIALLDTLYDFDCLLERIVAVLYHLQRRVSRTLQDGALQFLDLSMR